MTFFFSSKIRFGGFFFFFINDTSLLFQNMSSILKVLRLEVMRLRLKMEGKSLFVRL